MHAFFLVRRIHSLSRIIHSDENSWRASLLIVFAAMLAGGPAAKEG
jgi:hypothetical protein